MSANEKKNKQLGMAAGTVNARLRKLILFSLVQKTGQDICFRCGSRIETVNELSIEHKLPWLDVSIELFWDLANIAFSHLSCNVGSGRRSKQPQNLKSNIAANKSKSKKLNAPIGKAWCAGHKDYLPVERFRKDSFRLDGLRIYCQECRKK